MVSTATDTVSNAGLVYIPEASTCIVVPSQPSVSNYLAAPDKEHIITINRSTTTVTCGVGQSI